MTSKTILWTAVALIVVGLVVPSLYLGVIAGGLGQTYAWLIPVGYFVALVGAALLAYGWWKKRAIR